MERAERIDRLIKLSEKQKKNRNTAKRVPISGADVLVAKERVGFARRYVNDVRDKIERRIANGWTIVMEEADTVEKTSKDAARAGSPEIKVVGFDVLTGEAIRAILMEKPESQIKADRKLLDEEIDAREASMIKKDENAEGRYGSIKIGNAY